MVRCQLTPVRLSIMADKEATRLGSRIVKTARGVTDEITFPQDGSVALDQFALKDQVFLVLGVFMGNGGGSRLHSDDVPARCSVTVITDIQKVNVVLDLTFKIIRLVRRVIYIDDLAGASPGNR